MLVAINGCGEDGVLAGSNHLLGCALSHTRVRVKVANTLNVLAIAWRPCVSDIQPVSDEVDAYDCHCIMTKINIKTCRIAGSVGVAMCCKVGMQGGSTKPSQLHPANPSYAHIPAVQTQPCVF